ncbi:MAG TPA: YtxH domain-containing protein [Thermomicrobiales bacterium]|jgi:hypothetical protein|nr:YtxH domain-containing protein [Thermomicrobiales bacterium]
MARYGGAFVTGAVIGGVAGAALTLWRAPQAGRLTRSQLGEQLKAHAGPAAGLLEAAAHGLNAAGTRIVQGVAISTRFVEELIDPTPVDRLHQPTPVTTPPGPVPAAPTTTTTVEAATTAPAGSAAGGTSVPYRSAAMNVTPFPTNRTTH